jgi:hypothetical protein
MRYDTFEQTGSVNLFYPWFDMRYNNMSNSFPPKAFGTTKEHSFNLLNRCKLKQQHPMQWYDSFMLSAFAYIFLPPKISKGVLAI